MNHQILIAGFGGQGVLFAGKFLAYAGLIDGRQLSWLPSYGPEMRGGTANCGVIISDEPVGSPIVLEPNVLMALNAPSYEKFVDAVVPGGRIYIDTTLIGVKCPRSDVTVCYIPATGLAVENGLEGLANMIMTGKMIGDTGMFSEETLAASIKKCVSEERPELLGYNMKALALGAAFTER